MHIKKQSRKVWSGALLGLSTVALVGSAHAAVYSTETFEAGTPNYTITGGVFTQLQEPDGSGGFQNITSQTAVDGTDYITGSPSRSGIFANGTVPGAIGEPTGQHGFVSNSGNRYLRLVNPMTLLTDGAQTVNISFDTMVFGLGVNFAHTAVVSYSALGDFSDALTIASYATTNVTVPATPPTSILGQTEVTEDTWTTLNMSISAADVGGAFTNTAKIQFNKLPTSDSSQMVFYDNITVSTTVPEPSSAALLGLAGFALLLRRRK